MVQLSVPQRMVNQGLRRRLDAFQSPMALRMVREVIARGSDQELDDKRQERLADEEDALDHR